MLLDWKKKLSQLVGEPTRIPYNVNQHWIILETFHTPDPYKYMITVENAQMHCLSVEVKINIQTVGKNTSIATRDIFVRA